MGTLQRKGLGGERRCKAPSIRGSWLPPPKQEYLDPLKGSPRGKASNQGGFHIEYVLDGGELVQEVGYEVVCKAFQLGDLPSRHKKGIVYPLSKTGDPLCSPNGVGPLTFLEQSCRGLHYEHRSLLCIAFRSSFVCVLVDFFFLFWPKRLHMPVPTSTPPYHSRR